jgi:NADPH-dependent curcumin reductase CurA
MPETNRQVLLKRRPDGLPVAEDFAVVDSTLPEPGEGQVLLRGIYPSPGVRLPGSTPGRRRSRPRSAFSACRA